MAGLTARRGTGVEHAHTRTGVEKRRRKLRAAILHRHHPFLESGQCGYRYGALELNGGPGPGERARRRANLSKLGKILRHAHARQIDPQDKRRMTIARLENHLDMLRPCTADLINEPS